MHRFVAILAAVVMLLALSSTALAASPSQRECEAQGGTFSRENGEVSCVIQTSDPVGNSERSGGNSQTVDTIDDESSQGTLNNKPKHQQTSECGGPGNSTAQCP